MRLLVSGLYVCFFLSAASPAASGQSATLPPGTSAPDAPAAPSRAAQQPSQQINDPLGDAEAKLDAKDDATARTMLLAYVSAHPADARALFDLGYAEDALGDDPLAEAAYRKAIAAKPDQFESRAALGLLLAASGAQADAITQLEAAAKLTPNPPNPEAEAQADRALAELLEPGDPQAASKALIAALRRSTETPADTLLAGDIAAREGDANAAADAYGKVLASASQHSPAQAQAAAGLAHLLIAAKRYTDAEPVLRKALAADPQSPALNTELADVLVAEGKTQDATAVLENLHAAKPDDAGITVMLADLYEQNGAAGKADPLYAQLLAAHPHDATLLAARGDALVREGQYAQALPVLEEATQLAPLNGNAWSSLAFAASKTSRPGMVLTALSMRSKVMSETPATYFLAATAWDTLHQPGRAAQFYRQFLSVAGTGFPDEVWQAKQRLAVLAKER
jgi:tetratricopeptide (TPR) repeat protein